MAKKSKKKPLDVSIQDGQDAVINLIKKDIEALSLMSGTEVANRKFQIIPTTPSLDMGLRGGIKEGDWVLISGAPKTGKTTLALHVAANAQQEAYGSRNVFYIDVEGRIQEMHLRSIPHLDLDRLKFIRSQDNMCMSAEDFLNAAINIIDSHPGCLLILDSLAALKTRAELDQAMGESGLRGGVNKLLSEFCAKLSQRMQTNKSIVISITQQMANVTGYGKSKIDKGGTAIQYAHTVKLVATHREQRPAVNGHIIGQICHWIVETSSLGPPFDKPKMLIRYGSGIDVIAELISIGTEYGFINKSGAWLTLDYMKNHVPEWNDEISKSFKFQGAEKTGQALIDNPEWQTILDKTIKRKLLNIKI